MVDWKSTLNSILSSKLSSWYFFLEMHRLYQKIGRSLVGPLRRSKPQSDFYTKDHRWLDLHSGRCGLTPYFFEGSKSNDVIFAASVKTGRIRIGEQVGMIHSFCPITKEVLITPITSPVTGLIDKVNGRPGRRDLWVDDDYCGIVRDQFWLYQIKEIEQYDRSLMDYFSYHAYLMTLKA